MKLRQFRGIVFDLDGVITRTALVHYKAWKKTFDAFLEKKGSEEGKKYRPFEYEEDYIPFVDGKPRYDGVQSFLSSRDISLTYGEPGDSGEKKSICGIGNKKNETFRELVSTEGVEVYEGAIAFIRSLKKKGIRLGVASSSKNCRYILEKTGIIDLFQAVVGGLVSKEMKLNGKPAPDIFIEAARRLGLTPDECVMVEDALSGVEAGSNGNFSLVIGISRNGNNSDALYAHGADMVVRHLGEVDYKAIKHWFDEGLAKDGWSLLYRSHKPGEEKLREALTTVGNGYFGTRGCLVSEKSSEYHYPGTYIAGVYNRLPTEIHGNTIYNNDLVNCPNWLLLQIKIGDSGIASLYESEILEYRQELDMKNAVLKREITFKDEKNRITTFKTYRFASMANPHYAALKVVVIPRNYSEPVTVISALDGTVINYGVERYRNLSSNHLSSVSEHEADDTMFLVTRTNTSKISIFTGAKTLIASKHKKGNPVRETTIDAGYISQTLTIDCLKGEAVEIHKLVSIFTSNDRDSDNPEHDWVKSLDHIGSFDTMLQSHTLEWHKLWQVSDIEIHGDRFVQKAVRLHLYHLMSTASEHNKYIDAGLPARGLHGEAYRGHIFWDTVFILPFYNLHFPGISRSLLMYRYHRLDAARESARRAGYAGAMYPWQSADSGKEESQTLHFNPLSGEWDPDLSSLQRHVSIAILYNIFRYFYTTMDTDFLYNYGAEMIIEIIRFWASLAHFEDADGKYHIEGVMGPDEFHEKYPGSEKGGFRDNAYTNIMVGWLLHKGIKMMDEMPAAITERLSKKIGFEPEEKEKWKAIRSKLKVVLQENGIISQFDGFSKLKDLDFKAYREKYGDIHRMDRILKSEGDTPNRYKMAKQADVLMVYYLIAPGQVNHILDIMGYDTGLSPEELFKRNYEYYSGITTNGSTLSHIVHASIVKYLSTHTSEKWERFLTVMKSDISDIQGGTTQEGIHTGVMGGSIRIIFNSFAGINLFTDYIHIMPELPSHWKCLSFAFKYKDNRYRLHIDREKVTVTVTGTGESPAIEINGKTYRLKFGRKTVFAYMPRNHEKERKQEDG
ncbi:MAG: beta-phosphoglucomutase family hydrolase [Spirochaetales bacterium]|nr:beta-phosphoglucomutase family hydrolase [Spirochaetales bacterium]